MADYLATTVSAVGSVLCATIIGAVGIAFVPNPQVTLKGLSFITTAVMLPSLLMHHLGEAFTPTAMRETYVLPLMSIFGCFSGLIVGSIGAIFIFKGDPASAKLYRPLTMLFSAFQNAVILPLSLLTTVYHSKRVPWYDSKLYDTVVAYVFIYTIPVVVMIWSAGAMLVRRGAAVMRALELEQSGKGGATTTATSTTTGSPTSSTVRGSVATTGRFLRDILAAMWNPPFIANLFGMIIGLNPWIKAMISEWFPVVWDSMDILGKGVVPCALLMLGGNLASPQPEGGKGVVAAPAAAATVKSPRPASPSTAISLSAVSESPTIGTPAEHTKTANTTTMGSAPSTTAVADKKKDKPSTFHILREKVWKLVRPGDIPLKILLMVPLVRLVLVPITCVLFTHFVLRKLLGILPPPAQSQSSRAIWLVLLTEFTAPSAVNINLLCTLHGYLPATASKMIFYQYSMSVLSMVVWLMFTLWYVEHM